jgi:hypothetical protein
VFAEIFMEDSKCNANTVISQSSHYSLPKKDLLIINDTNFSQVIYENSLIIYVEKDEKIKNRKRKIVKCIHSLFIDLVVTLAKRKVKGNDKNDKILLQPSMTVSIGSCVSIHDGNKLEAEAACPLITFEIKVPKILLNVDNSTYEVELENSFDLDYFRAYILQQLVGNERNCRELIGNIGIKSKMFYRKAKNAKSVQISDAISSTQILFKILYNLQGKKQNDIFISFGKSLSSDSSILTDNYAQNLLRYKNMTTERSYETSTELDSTIDTFDDSTIDSFDHSLAYSQSSEFKFTLNDPAIYESKKVMASNTRSAVDISRALIRQLYVNDFPLNPFYHGFTIKIEEAWMRYFTTNADGKRCIASLSPTFSFAVGPVLSSLPNNFLPYGYTMNDKDEWIAHPIWISYLANAPFKPIRAAYPPEIGTFVPPNHPNNNANIQSKPKESVADVLKQYITSINGPTKATDQENEKELLHYQQKSIHFTSSHLQVKGSVSVVMDKDKSLLDHLKAAAEINNALFIHIDSDSEEIILTTLQNNTTCPSIFTIKNAKNSTLKSIISEIDVKWPLTFTVEKVNKIKSAAIDVHVFDK